MEADRDHLAAVRIEMGRRGVEPWAGHLARLLEVFDGATPHPHQRHGEDVARAITRHPAEAEFDDWIHRLTRPQRDELLEFMCLLIGEESPRARKEREAAERDAAILREREARARERRVEEARRRAEAERGAGGPAAVEPAPVGDTDPSLDGEQEPGERPAFLPFRVIRGGLYD